MRTRFQKDEAAECTLVSTGHRGTDSMTTLTLQSVRRRLQIRDALRYRDDTNSLRTLWLWQLSPPISSKELGGSARLKWNFWRIRSISRCCLELSRC
jgi:hypothetical protein